MTRRLVLVLAFLLPVTETADAQIIRSSRSNAPIGFVSLGIGWFQQQGLCNEASNSCWDFGSGPQWRATVELPVGNGASFGVAGTMGRMPLTYDGGVGTASCGQCDADANISQILALFRIGGGSGFHQVIDLSAGVTLFSNFRRSDSGTRLGDGKMVQNYNFSIGYGFGYSLSPRTSIQLVQDYGLLIHGRVPGSSDNTAQQSSTRIGVRLGLGERGRGF